MQAGDRLLDADGRSAIVAATSRESHPEGVPIFNFEVEGLHNYFVAANAKPPFLSVHNDSRIPPPNEELARISRELEQLKSNLRRVNEQEYELVEQLSNAETEYELGPIDDRLDSLHKSVLDLLQRIRYLENLALNLLSN